MFQQSGVEKTGVTRDGMYAVIIVSPGDGIIHPDHKSNRRRGKVTTALNGLKAPFTIDTATALVAAVETGEYAPIKAPAIARAAIMRVELH